MSCSCHVKGYFESVLGVGASERIRIARYAAHVRRHPALLLPRDGSRSLDLRLPRDNNHGRPKVPRLPREGDYSWPLSRIKGMSKEVERRQD